MQLFSAGTTIKKFEYFFAPKYINSSPQNLVIIPLDQEFSVDQVFALWN